MWPTVVQDHAPSVETDVKGSEDDCEASWEKPEQDEEMGEDPEEVVASYPLFCVGDRLALLGGVEVTTDLSPVFKSGRDQLLTSAMIHLCSE